MLPARTGGFIYVATVGVLPPLLQRSDPWQTAKECACMWCGIGLMLLVMAFE